eukprot:TRINITY_DN3680_c0_g2_i2.p2 TRINITY_DN3680_c0_g2~~TRINITY_DN3680_c0_g2_i2.p2  ORF type:complete len:162 (-),score=5.00 TRINITY_DN3680_c0_g2_i2:151-636(-)
MLSFFNVTPPKSTKNVTRSKGYKKYTYTTTNFFFSHPHKSPFLSFKLQAKRLKNSHIPKITIQQKPTCRIDWIASGNVITKIFQKSTGNLSTEQSIANGRASIYFTSSIGLSYPQEPSQALLLDTLKALVFFKPENLQLNSQVGPVVKLLTAKKAASFTNY